VKARKLGRAVVTGIAVAGAAGLVALAATGASAASSSTARPALKLVAGSTDVTLENVEGYGVDLDLGTHVVAGNAPIEEGAPSS